MEPICGICLAIFKPTEKLLVTPCGHVGHKSCMEIWFQRSVSCPYCRRPLRSVGHLFLNFNNSENSSQEDFRRLIEESRKKVTILEDQLEAKNTLIQTQHLLEIQLYSKIRTLQLIETKFNNLKKSAAYLTKRLEEEREKNRLLEMILATTKVKQNKKLGENSVKSKAKTNVSKAKDTTRAPRVPLGAVDQNSEEKPRYNLRPR